MPPFDPSSAKPVAAFDPASAQPLATQSSTPNLNQRLTTSAPFRALRGAFEPVMGGIQDIAHAVAMIPGQGQAATDLDAMLKHGEQTYQADRQATGNGGVDLARIGGNIASPVNYMLPEIGAGLKLKLAAKLGLGAAQGGALGLLQPVFDTDGSSFGGQKATQAAFGAGGGAAAPAIASGVSKVISPTISDHARTLLDAGIRLTPGQIFGGGLRATEDKISSWPVVGSFITGAQQRATQDFNRTVFDRALEPIGLAFPKNVPIGRDGVSYVAKKIGDVYDTVLPTMTGAADDDFITALRGVVDNAKGEGASPAVLERLHNVMKAQIVAKASPNSTFDGNSLKNIQSELGRIAAKHSGSDSADDRILGDAVDATHQAFRDMLMRLNPDQAPTLKAADTAWANYVRIRRAASGVGAKDGKFSGPQFANAVRGSDKSVGHGDYAKGRALMQDLSDAGTSTLPAAYPDSGTAGRAALMAILGGTHFVAPPVAAVGAGLSGLYTRPGQALIRGVIARKGNPNAAAAASAAGLFGSGPLATLLSQQAVSGP